jgi:hypothetical protein
MKDRIYSVVLGQKRCDSVVINLLKPSGKLIYYVPPVLTLKNSTWCPHCVYVFCTDLRTNSNFWLIKHKRLVFITEVESVYSAVRTESLYKADTPSARN